MSENKKLFEEVREALDDDERAFGMRHPAALAALSQLEAILNEVGELPDKWETAARDFDAWTPGLPTLAQAAASELRTALQGGQG